MKQIQIEVSGIILKADLDENSTTQAIWDALPIKGNANTWGDEIYFDTPLRLTKAADARADVEVGELGFWVPGNAFCIFYGITPASTGNKPRAASPVNVFGRVKGDATVLKSVDDGAAVKITRIP